MCNGIFYEKCLRRGEYVLTGRGKEREGTGDRGQGARKERGRGGLRRAVGRGLKGRRVAEGA